MAVNVDCSISRNSVKWNMSLKSNPEFYLITFNNFVDWDLFREHNAIVIDFFFRFGFRKERKMIKFTKIDEKLFNRLLSDCLVTDKFSHSLLHKKFYIWDEIKRLHPTFGNWYPNVAIEISKRLSDPFWLFKLLKIISNISNSGFKNKEISTENDIKSQKEIQKYAFRPQIY